MSDILKNILTPIKDLQLIRGVELPVGLEFLQLIVTGPPGAGKTFYINQIRGWPNEGYIDLTQKKWWKNQNLIYRPREVHLGLPFKGQAEALTVFDKEWVEADPPLELELSRIKIPPLHHSFFKTNWKHKYIFEFILPKPKTVYKRRIGRHDEGYFPVDTDLTLDMVRQQLNVYKEVALYLHRAKMQVYIRKDIHTAPMKIMEKGDTRSPAWLLANSEKTGKIIGSGSFRNLFIKRKKTNWISPGQKRQEITETSRIAHDGKPLNVWLGNLQLYFQPEIPLGIKKKNIEKNWLIYSCIPCSVKNIMGFSRLRAGDSIVLGRENPQYNDLFNFDENIGNRHLQVANIQGDLILTPLDIEKKVSVQRAEGEDIRERVASHRFEALTNIRDLYGGPIQLLPPEEAFRLAGQTCRLVSTCQMSPQNHKGKAGGIVNIPDKTTSIIIGDLHGQVDNLLKIITENSILECLHARTVTLIILGDGVHSEVIGEMEDMDSSILMMDIIFTLKTAFPENVHYLRGNHDSFDPDLSKNGISQGLLMKQRLLELRGLKYVQEMEYFYNTIPCIARSKNFFACHAGPPTRKVSYNELINIHENQTLIKDLISGRIERPGYLQGYKKGDVKKFRKILNLSKGTPFIVGHTPMDPFGSFWRDAGHIKNHHIIYSGHQEGPHALLIEEGKVIHLEFSSEPVLKLINKSL